ncbi:dipeptidase [Seohaeicola nanhaiensis]|uniref:Dipeptidase n=1 Tax=Seohaeicola nanhaiensis TaxID=1387282 RepID=A0ABV9KNU6_9RHOB
MTEAAARDWLDANEPALRDRLYDFVRLPSVSTDPAYAEGMGQAAEFLSTYLRDIGFDRVAVNATPGHPILTGEWTGAPGAPTILVYGHYDVQPPDPLDQWQSAPFEPTLRDGRIYGRGISDDKGPLMVALGAMEALMATTGALPVNVRLLIEGSEEMGSAHLEDFVVAHQDLVTADFLLSADGAMWRADLPSVTVASRGMAALNVTVRGAAKDLHSGRYGGGVPNAAQVLVEMLAALHDPRTGAVAVPGFYDGVAVPDNETRAALADIPFDEAAFLEGLGVKKGAGEAGYSFLERNWLRPTLEINGMSAGYTGPGFKTVIGATAEAKISCRLVPGQDPMRILELLEAELTRLCPDCATLSIARKPGVAWPSALPLDHPGLRLAMDVLEELYGQPARAVRMGATIPIAEMFDRVLDMGTVFFSFSTADEDYHAPNEFFRLERWQDGLRAWVAYLTRLAKAA